MASFTTLIVPENAEIMRRMADVKGWTVDIKPTAEAPEEWWVADFRKTGPERQKPNPHGLHIVKRTGNRK